MRNAVHSSLGDRLNTNQSFFHNGLDMKRMMIHIDRSIDLLSRQNSINASPKYIVFYTFNICIALSEAMHINMIYCSF